MTQAIFATRKRDVNGNTVCRANSRQWETTWEQSHAAGRTKLTQAALVACRIMSRGGKSTALYQVLDAGPGEDTSDVFAPVPGDLTTQLRLQVLQMGGFEITQDNNSINRFVGRAGSWSCAWSIEDVTKATTELDAEGWPKQEEK